MPQAPSTMSSGGASTPAPGTPHRPGGGHLPPSVVVSSTAPVSLSRACCESYASFLESITNENIERDADGYYHSTFLRLGPLRRCQVTSHLRQRVVRSRFCLIACSPPRKMSRTACERRNVSIPPDSISPINDNGSWRNCRAFTKSRHKSVRSCSCKRSISAISSSISMMPVAI